MERAQEPAPHPAQLPPGTVVGGWRVVCLAGRGAYGAVYRAVRAEVEDATLAGSVALKVALLPEDPHLDREVELLSRTRHPSIPRLRDSGVWQHPSGAVHPFIVMDWVEGVPLYEWAKEHAPSSQQVCRLLSQLAGALAEVHAQDCIHRDVKGANVLVRRGDGRAMLTDFGSSRYPEATLLTPQQLLPGTPAYQPPEAALFPLRFGRDATARYQAGPADDVYALGVLAYRLVTGQYPELGEPFKDAKGCWQPGELGSPAPHTLNPQVEPRLSGLILRMLSVKPEERGTAVELARALEQGAQQPAPESVRPLVAREVLAPADAVGHTDAEKGDAPEESSRARGSSKLDRPRTPGQRESHWLLALAATVAVIVAAGWAVWRTFEQPSFVAGREAAGANATDAGTSGLGETVSSVSNEDISAPSLRKGMAEEPMPEPLPGQTRPDARGRCPRKRQVALNGGCWLETPLEREGCAEINGQMFKGACYVPFIPPGRGTTSNPAPKP